MTAKVSTHADKIARAVADESVSPGVLGYVLATRMTDRQLSAFLNTTVTIYENLATDFDNNNLEEGSWRWEAAIQAKRILDVLNAFDGEVT